MGILTIILIIIVGFLIDGTIINWGRDGNENEAIGVYGILVFILCIIEVGFNIPIILIVLVLNWVLLRLTYFISDKLPLWGSFTYYIKFLIIRFLILIIYIIIIYGIEELVS